MMAAALASLGNPVMPEGSRHFMLETIEVKQTQRNMNNNSVGEASRAMPHSGTPTDDEIQTPLESENSSNIHTDSVESYSPLGGILLPPCGQCRTQRRGCVPKFRKASEPCDNCIKAGFACSGPIQLELFNDLNATEKAALINKIQRRQASELIAELDCLFYLQSGLKASIRVQETDKEREESNKCGSHRTILDKKSRTWIDPQSHYRYTTIEALSQIDVLLRQYQAEAIPIIKQMQQRGAIFEASHLARLCQGGLDYGDATELNKSSLQEVADGLDKRTGLWFRWLKRCTPILDPLTGEYCRISISPEDFTPQEILRQHTILRKVVGTLESLLHDTDDKTRSWLHPHDYECAQCLNGSCFSQNTFAKIDPLIFRAFKFCCTQTMDGVRVFRSFLEATHAADLNQLTKENGDSFLQAVLQLDDNHIKRASGSLLSELARYTVLLSLDDRNSIKSMLIKYNHDSNETILQYAMKRPSRSTIQHLLELYTLLGMEQDIHNETIFLSSSAISRFSMTAAKVLKNGCKMTGLMLAILHRNDSGVKTFLRFTPSRAHGISLVGTEISGRTYFIGPLHLACMMEKPYDLETLRRISDYQALDQSQVLDLGLILHIMKDISVEPAKKAAIWIEVFNWVELNTLQRQKILNHIEQLDVSFLLKPDIISEYIYPDTQRFQSSLAADNQTPKSTLDPDITAIKANGTPSSTPWSGDTRSIAEQPVKIFDPKLNGLPSVLQDIRQRLDRERAVASVHRNVVYTTITTGWLESVAGMSGRLKSSQGSLGTRSSLESMISGKSSIQSLRTASSGGDSTDHFVKTQLMAGWTASGFSRNKSRGEDIMETQNEEALLV